MLNFFKKMFRCARRNQSPHRLTKAPAAAHIGFPQVALGTAMSDLTDVTRKLVAVFAADVEGYSRLMGADEVGTLKGLTECPC